MNLSTRLIDVLGLGRTFLRDLAGSREVVREGGAFGDLQNDTELKGDKQLGEFLAAKMVENFPEVRRVTVEGLGELSGNTSGHLWATIDPIDGSLNLKHSGRMNGFPFSSCITLLQDGDRVLFHDLVAAGVIDLRLEITDAWVAERAPRGHFLTRSGQLTRGLHPVRTLEVFDLNLGQMNVIGEMYYPENRGRLVQAFGGRKEPGAVLDPMRGWLRSIGSAAYEMASVASGQAAAFICLTQKQHELGAGIALVKGAAGVAVDWDGRDLGPRVYDFNTQTPVILAANQMIADQILELLNRG